MLATLLGTNPSGNAVKVGQSLAHSLVNVLLNPSLVRFKHVTAAGTSSRCSRPLRRLGTGRVDEMPGLEMGLVCVSSRKAARGMAGHLGGAVVEGASVGLLLRVLFKVSRQVSSDSECGIAVRTHELGHVIALLSGTARVGNRVGRR